MLSNHDIFPLNNQPAAGAATEGFLQNGMNSLPFSQMQKQQASVSHVQNTLSVQKVLFGIAQTFTADSVRNMYSVAAEYSGNYVKLSADYRCLPVLERAGLPPVFLYRLVEVFDGLIDYEYVIEELPGLSYSQINGAFSFLRRLAQFNTAGVDVDEIEQRYLTQDEELIASLRQAISEGEPTHVLAAD